MLAQIDDRLFQAYVQPRAAQMGAVVAAGVASPAWEPAASRPNDASTYVYDVLLALVVVHSDVVATAPALVGRVLRFLQEQLSQALIEAFQRRPRYSLPALMQATLDVEFLAQTMNNYSSDRASHIQSQIYLRLDERTDNDARLQLQRALADMRTILKRLREKTRGEL